MMKIENWNGPEPTGEELAAAPIVEAWQIHFGDYGPQIFGWFFGHPFIDDGRYGHSSPVQYIDAVNTPARWAKAESRLYRLGAFYLPAERDIREACHKLQSEPLVFGQPLGGGDDVQEMVKRLEAANVYRPSWLARLYQKYLEEKDLRN
ncbi:hypothetical protein [Rhizobium phaseoli]|nr:hypothetical protein [Rhizobium phaseoli]